MIDCGEFSFEENYLLKYLICKVCGLVLRNPMRLHRCGHTFCERCAPGVEKQCEQCGLEVEAKQVDLTSSNLIADLGVKCNAPDCPFQGSFEEYISNHKGMCTMRKHGGINTWLTQIQNSLDELNEVKQKQSIAQVVEISDPQRVENVLIEENDANPPKIGKQTNLIQISNTDNEMPVVDLVQCSSSFDKNADNHKQSCEIMQETPGAEQKFIECIELDRESKNVAQKPAQNVDSSQVFIQHYFNPRKNQSKSKQQKPKPSIIEL